MTLTEAGLENVAQRLHERLPVMIDEVRRGLRKHWPEYADALDGGHEGVMEAATLFTPRLLETMYRPGDHRPSADLQDQRLRQVFEQIGRREMRQGSDLTRLLTAFQYGSRVAWRHVSVVALESELSSDDLAALADAVFGEVNNLSFAAAHGYLMEQMDDSRAREEAREELAVLLLSGRSSEATVRAAARRAGWRVPQMAAVALVDPEDDVARQVIDGLGPENLPVRGPTRYGAIIPEGDDAAGRLHLRRVLRGAHAVVGAVVGLDRLPRSAEIAEIAARLRHEKVIEAADPVFADEHLATIIVWRDPLLLDKLRAQVLAPLDGLPEAARERLLETLVSWHRHMGDRKAVAEELHIHPQTVRYRLAQLRDHFGDELDDPRSRARLFLALQWGR